MDKSSTGRHFLRLASRGDMPPAIFSSSKRPGAHLGRLCERGFTLIEVMISVACLVIIAAGIAIATKNNLSFQNVVATGSAYRDLELSFRLGVATALTTAGSSVCQGQAFTATEVIPGNTNVFFKLSSSIPALPSNAPPGTTAAWQRCNAGQMRTLSNNGDFYFCVLFSGTGNTSYSSSSLEGAPLVFAEVEATPYNVVSGAALNCPLLLRNLAGVNQPSTQGQGVWNIAYSLYWYDRSTPPTFKRRNSAFYSAINVL